MIKKYRDYIFSPLISILYVYYCVLKHRCVLLLCPLKMAQDLRRHSLDYTHDCDGELCEHNPDPGTIMSQYSGLWIVKLTPIRDTVWLQLWARMCICIVQYVVLLLRDRSRSRIEDWRLVSESGLSHLLLPVECLSFWPAKKASFRFYRFRSLPMARCFKLQCIPDARSTVLSYESWPYKRSILIMECPFINNKNWPCIRKGLTSMDLISGMHCTSPFSENRLGASKRSKWLSRNLFLYSSQDCD